MLGARVDDVAHDLLEFAELETAEWIATCSDDDFVRICSVANWLLHHGPTTASGASMQIGRACALAAVYIREGRPRDLARSRRVKVPPQQIEGGRFVNYRLQQAVPQDYGVRDDARRFWQD